MSAEQFAGILNQTVADTLTPDFWQISLPNALATSSARSPSLFAYYAALNLLDAPVLFSKAKVSELLDPSLKAKKSAIERHHLFPRGYLKKRGITDTSVVNQIANYALVEWPDNVELADRPPAEHVPQMEARFPEQELAVMHDLHALPEGWVDMDYDQFLVARRRLMAGVIRRAFEEKLASGTDVR